MNATAETCINNPVLRYLVEALLFSSSVEDESLDKGYSICDIDKGCLDRLYSGFQQFIDRCEAEITSKLGGEWESLEDFYLGSYPDGCVERDFIYTRNHEGTGFWDCGRWDKKAADILTGNAHRFTQIECYVGDGDKIYFM
jgi:hypothetical protein